MNDSRLELHHERFKCCLKIHPHFLLLLLFILHGILELELLLRRVFEWFSHFLRVYIFSDWKSQVIFLLFFIINSSSHSLTPLYRWLLTLNEFSLLCGMKRRKHENAIYGDEMKLESGSEVKVGRDGIMKVR